MEWINADSLSFCIWMRRRHIGAMRLVATRMVPDANRSQVPTSDYRQYSNIQTYQSAASLKGVRSHPRASRRSAPRSIRPHPRVTQRTKRIRVNPSHPRRSRVATSEKIRALKFFPHLTDYETFRPFLNLTALGDGAPQHVSDLSDGSDCASGGAGRL